jgi:hypothetical protein
MVLDPYSLNAGVEIVAHVALIVDVQFPAQKVAIFSGFTRPIGPGLLSCHPANLPL